MANESDKTEKDAEPTGGEADELIAQNLRRVYDEVASEPIPDRFTKLLEKLKDKERK